MSTDRSSQDQSKTFLRDRAPDLVRLALKTLPRMIVPETGIFCGQLARDDLTPRHDVRKSARYTIICLLGLARAQIAGHKVDIDIASTYEKIYDLIDSLSIGDFGLLLWLDHRLGGRRAAELVGRTSVLLRDIQWHAINGMELAWLIVGLTEHASKVRGEAAELADSLVRYLISDRSAPSGLFYQVGKGLRRRFPNFATQIYSIHALAVRAQAGHDRVSGERAIRAAQSLSELQRKDGAWPWIYDAEKGVVAEPYEIYSVHQDGMAPMAFQELHAAAGLDYKRIIASGLNWIYGGNDLGANMIDDCNGMIYRSIRRKLCQRRPCLYLRVAASVLGVTLPAQAHPSALEVNFTCRPYHMGWILEAFCGREL